ncbi:MAG: hypothetical protein ACT6FD_06175 [Methanosarcinaceae archaeon]
MIDAIYSVLIIFDYPYAVKYVQRRKMWQVFPMRKWRTYIFGTAALNQQTIE